MIEAIAIGTLLAALAESGVEAEGRPLPLLFRGSQRPDDRSVRGVPSYTPSLGVALVWSAVPADPWHDRPAAFLPSSTVRAVRLHAKNPCVLRDGLVYSTLANVLDRLGYGQAQGITDEEVSRLLRYLHRRLIGAAPGGDFRYVVRDEEGKERDHSEVEFSLVDPQTLLSEVRWEWDAGDHDIAHRVEADTYVFADAPVVQKVTARLGYDALVYRDVFEGGTSATETLLGVEVWDLPGVREDEDLDLEPVPSHLTVRPLSGAVLEEVWRKPSTEVLVAGEWRGP